MAEADSLAASFLQMHPQEAARVLDALPPAQVAALWRELPARLLAPCAAAMRPAAAGQALLALEDEAAIALIAALPAARAAAMLRPLHGPRRASWLARQPARHGMACQALLQYPPDAVGALTDPAVLVFGADADVAAATATVHAAEQAQDLVLVEDHRHGLLGAVPVGALLMAHPDDRLLRWCQPVAALPALMPAAAALTSTGWREGFRRPVVDADGRLVGLVAHQALLRAPQTAPAAATDTALGWAGQAYWRALSGLAEWLCGLLAPSASARPHR